MPFQCLSSSYLENLHYVNLGVNTFVRTLTPTSPVTAHMRSP